MRKKDSRRNAAAIKDIPYERCYEEAGMIEVAKGVFTHSYEILKPVRTKEMTYSAERARGRMRSIFSLLGNRPFQFVSRNSQIPEEAYLNGIMLKAEENDPLQSSVESYNRLLAENVGIGHNNYESRIFLTVSIDDTDAAGAAGEFEVLDGSIRDEFEKLYGYRAEPMTLEERLAVLGSIYHPGDSPEISAGKKKGRTTKERIAPRSIEYDRNYMRIDGKYVRILFLNALPSELPESLLCDISAVSGDSIISASYEPLDATLGLRAAENMVRENTRMEKRAIRETIEDRRERKEIVTEIPIEENEDAYFYEQAKETFSAGERREPVLLVTILIALFSDTPDMLDRDTSLLKLAVSKYGGHIRTCDYQQKESFQSILPLNQVNVHFARAFPLRRIASVFPINVQSLFETKPMFQGLNMINDNFIFSDRRNCPVGLIAGMDHTGKTFAVKREVLNALLMTRDKVFVLTDKPGDYKCFLSGVGGKELSFSPDIFIKDADYALSDDMGMFAQMALMACMAAHSVYYKERYTAAERDEIKKHIAQEAEMISYQRFQTVSEAVSYAKNYSEAFPLFLSAFGEIGTTPTEHVSRCNLISCTDAQGMLMALDHLWNYAIRERKANRNIWIYVDGCDEMLYATECSDYLLALMDKAGKLQVPLTFVLNDSVHVVTSQDASIELDYFVKKISYFKLLSLGPIERKWFTERLNINRTLFPYITDREPGEGILITPTLNVAFTDRFDAKDSRFYQQFQL